MYGKRSFSQKTALILEIVSVLMLIPAVFGLFLAGIIVLGAGAKGNLPGVLIGLTPFAIAATGVILLIGYHKHANSTLDDRWRPALWAGSFAFNALPLVPLVYHFLSTPFALLSKDGSFALAPLWIWWSVAAAGSALSFFRDHADQKYR